MSPNALHDFRNRLTALESQVYMVKKHMNPNDEKLKKYIERMEQTIQELKKDLTRLHDVTKSTD